MYNKERLDELIKESGVETKFSGNTKALAAYFGGKSKRYEQIFKAVEESGIPVRYRKAVACSLLNGYLNGRVEVPGCHPGCETMRHVLYIITKPEEIRDVFKAMEKPSLDKWNEVIAVIDEYKRKIMGK